VLLSSVVGVGLEESLNRVLGFDALVCPDRGMGVQVSRFCETRVLQLVMRRDERSCAFLHNVNLYEDGALHYFVSELGDDRYFRMSPKERDQLVQYASSLEGDEIIAIPVRRAERSGAPETAAQRTRWIVLTPESTRMLANEVSRRIDLVWIETPASSSTACVPGMAYPNGQLGLADRAR
jgi:hypothetical protein